MDDALRNIVLHLHCILIMENQQPTNKKIYLYHVKLIAFPFPIAIHSLLFWFYFLHRLKSKSNHLVWNYKRLTIFLILLHCKIYLQMILKCRLHYDDNTPILLRQFAGVSPIRLIHQFVF